MIIAWVCRIWKVTYLTEEIMCLAILQKMMYSPENDVFCRKWKVNPVIFLFTHVQKKYVQI